MTVGTASDGLSPRGTQPVFALFRRPDSLRIPNGRTVRVAGNVIVRQRPGTAKGIVFMSLEDETGISNVVIMPDLFERQRLDILSYPWVMVEGEMQNVDHVIHILARRVAALESPLTIGIGSHDFH